MPTRRSAAAVAGLPRHADLPGQVVLVLQGGGALGAYHVGAYEALHEAGIEPDWLIGTSMGAINAALIAGNAPARRMERLDAFWGRLASPSTSPLPLAWLGLEQVAANLATLLRGIPAFFAPSLAALGGALAPVGVEAAAWYSTRPLRATLGELVDLELLQRGAPRLTVGAVNAVTGRMRYFDSRAEPVGLDHVMASGALPPAFPAVRIEGQPYWDGGLYSNTPIEAVLDDRPRRDSLIFAVNVWQQGGPEPDSIWQVMARQKDIQYASRADSHLLRQKQLHRLRHVIRQLAQELPPAKRKDPRVQELVDWGCGTTMHVAHLVAPRLEAEDQTKDIDFTPAGVGARRAAGYADAMRMLRRAPWLEPTDPIEGVVEHF
jgi:NTE family protein